MIYTNLYATDGKCHNAEPDTFGHECGKPATYIGVSFSGRASGFCDECRRHGYEAQGLVFHRIALAVDQTQQGPQLVIPGSERSAHQAASARAGRIRPRKPQQEPGGLFSPRALPQPDLFEREG